MVPEVEENSTNASRSRPRVSSSNTLAATALARSTGSMRSASRDSMTPSVG